MQQITKCILLLCFVPSIALGQIINSSLLTCNGASAEVRYAQAGGLSSDTTIVAAVSGKRIRVLRYLIGNTDDAAEAAVTWRSGAAGTAISGAVEIPPDTAIAVNCQPYGCFHTGVNTLLELDVDAGTVGLDITYIECDG